MYNLDASDARPSLLRSIENLRAIDAQLANNLQRVALRSERSVTWRVQQEGQNTAGDYMESRSRNKIGAYSQMAGEDRQSRGFQTDHIDLTLTGQMFDSWQTQSDGSGGYGVGFTNSEAEYKADENEMLFGQVFGLDEHEQADAIEYMDQLTTETIYQHGG